MLTLCDDLFIKISELLEDDEKIAVTMTTVLTDRLKYIFRYHNKINMDHILIILSASN